MKILFLADEESKMYWEYFKKEDFKPELSVLSDNDGWSPSFVCAWQSR